MDGIAIAHDSRHDGAVQPPPSPPSSLSSQTAAAAARPRPVAAGLRVLEAEAASLVALAALYRERYEAEADTTTDTEGNTDMATDTDTRTDAQQGAEGQADGRGHGQHDDSPPRQFDRAVEAIVRSRRRGGKLVVTGVGKSGHVGRKLSATCQSVGVASVFLHATEALHGDVGVLAPHDVLLVVSSSGRTAELVALVDHLARSGLADALQLGLVALSSQVGRRDCELLSRWDDYHHRDCTAAAATATGGTTGTLSGGVDGGGIRARARASPGIHLPAPTPVSDRAALGVAAPTMSTTAALALGDALALAAADRLHGSTEQVAGVFARNHPGGSIGLGLG